MMRQFIVILMLACITLSYSANAQSLYNSSTVSIGPSSFLFVKDSLINNGLIINNGDMQIGGSWVNNNQYDAGTGKITFNSPLPQVINHNAQSFSRLIIGGGGEKIFQADLTIEDEFDLEDGILTSENGARIVFAEGAIVTGGSDNAHINGPVYHIGSGDKVFPIGNGAQFLPVEILGISSTTEVGVREVEIDGSTILNRDTELTDISFTRYWEIDVVSGSLAGSRIALPIRNETMNIPDFNFLVVAQANDLEDPFRSLGQSEVTGDISDGTVVSELSATQNFVALAILGDDRTITVYNAISPGEDGKNDYMHISNITKYEDNIVSIFNRWGDKVFELSRYDNDGRVFRGNANVAGKQELPTGTYFYVIDKGDGSPKVTGYVSLRRPN